MEKRIAAVTGGNKGIGFEICLQLAKNNVHVILTSRDEQKGKNALDELKSHGFDVSYYQLDVTDEKSVENFANYVEDKFGRLDILVNNAGVFLDQNGIENSNIELIKKTMDTNFYGALFMTKFFLPLMKKNNYGRVINISSGMGQLADMGGGSLAYRVSKTSLNALTLITSKEIKEYNIQVNSICPGWVKTDMGGTSAPRTLEQGADSAVWLALMSDNGPNGKFFRDRKEIPW